QQHDAVANEVADRRPPSLAQRDQTLAVGLDSVPGRPAARDAVQARQTPEQLDHLVRGQRFYPPNPVAQELPPARHELGAQTVPIGLKLAEERRYVGEDRVQALVLIFVEEERVEHPVRLVAAPGA